MPAERGKDAAERFAAAVDSGRPLRSAGSDAALARELDIVARLRSRENTLGSHDEAVAMLRSGIGTYGPRPDEKARAKARLMAMLADSSTVNPAEPQSPAAGRVVELPAVTADDLTAPMPILAGDVGDAVNAVSAADSGDTAGAEPDEETLAPVTPLAGRTRRGRHTLPAAMQGEAIRRRRAGADPRHGHARRAGVVGSAALFVLIAFTGAGVFVSQDALPGQTLYPLKRAAEAAALAMTFDDEARAQRNLELAAIRLGEVEQLVASGSGSPVDPQLVQAAMSEFDVATSQGSKGLLGERSSDASGDRLQAWAATQSARLSALRPALPDPAVPAADTSIALLDKLLARSPDRDSTPAIVNNDEELPQESDRDPRTPERPGGTVGGTDSEEPSEDSDGGLPGLGPDSGPFAPESESDDLAGPESETPSEVTEDGESGRLPLPLPGAPTTLPPVLPGMPPLTVG